MSQVSPTPLQLPSFGIPSSQIHELLTAPSSVEASQHLLKVAPNLAAVQAPTTAEYGPDPHAKLEPQEAQAAQNIVTIPSEYIDSRELPTVDAKLNIDHLVDILERGTPTTALDYAEHLYKVASLFLKSDITEQQFVKLENKFILLADMLPQFVEVDNPATSQLYLVVERCFDTFIRITTSNINVLVASLTIRFLTSVVMSLNYWELYNLLRWKPAIYQFLTLIRFDLNDCYARFIRDYLKYEFRQRNMTLMELQSAAYTKEKNKKDFERRLSMSESPDVEGGADDKSPLYFMNKELSEDHDKFVTEQMAAEESERPIPRERRKIRVDSKLAAHRVIKRADIKVAPSSRSSNYDPDVVHECQMPSPDEPDKLCLRRFSRKYELIRHQETVHSKKKKLFKCFVCVKQDPSIGPRIFTRHDTLAKHIRVNHRISGKEAKAEVAYSKKHAEIVEEGDITVHVGRRKTKVDFELRAHMEKKGSAREAPDGSIIFDDVDDSPPDSIEFGEDEEIYDDVE